MPAYNEQATIRTIVARVLAVDLGPVEKELVIVDDGSKDGTREILKELDGKDGVRVFFRPHNQGKGAAVWRGMRESHRRHGDHPGRRSRIRSARIFPADSTDPRWRSRRRLRIALSWIAARPPRVVLLALGRQSDADDACGDGRVSRLCRADTSWRGPGSARSERKLRAHLEIRFPPRRRARLRASVKSHGFGRAGASRARGGLCRSQGATLWIAVIVLLAVAFDFNRLSHPRNIELLALLPIGFLLFDVMAVLRVLPGPRVLAADGLGLHRHHGGEPVPAGRAIVRAATPARRAGGRTSIDAR